MISLIFQSMVLGLVTGLLMMLVVTILYTSIVNLVKGKKVAALAMQKFLNNFYSWAVVYVIAVVITTYLMVAGHQWQCGNQGEARGAESKYDIWTSSCYLKDGSRWVTPDNYGRAVN